MHREEELEGLAACALCGAPLRSTDRAYAFDAERDVLCYECAIARGGRYDADEDRWTVPPRVGDLRRPGD